MARHIGADEVVYQNLEDLKAACVEAVEDSSEVTDFEAGVFCGKYETDIPAGYFEHLSQLRGEKKKATNGLVNVSSGPQKLSKDNKAVAASDEPKDPEHRDDIRYVTGGGGDWMHANQRSIE